MDHGGAGRTARGRRARPSEARHALDDRDHPRGPRRVTLYVDSSALAKRYVAEPDSDAAEAILLADPRWVTAGHTYVEVTLALARRLDEDDVSRAQESFERDWARIHVVCRRAAAIGVVTGARTLDALHLAAAERAVGRSGPLFTFDVRLAQVARSMGFAVLGA
jgi:predicted nucleic acid-binding protein